MPNFFEAASPPVLGWSVIIQENGITDYTSDPKLRTPRPWCPGYVVTEQVAGKTDINSTRFISL
jgi:hypothetical protein